MEDIFAVQDEITREIVTSLDVKLVKGEQARIFGKSLRDPQALDLFYRGMELLNPPTPETRDRARKLFEDVARMEPESPLGYLGLGRSFFYEAWFGHGENRERATEQTESFASKILTLDDANADAHSLLAWCHLMTMQHERALSEAQLAVSLSPSQADNFSCLALVMLYVNRAEECLAMVRRAMRLCPIYPTFYLHVMSAAHREAGQPEKGLEVVREAIRRDPDYYLIRVVAASIHSELGRYEEARAEAEEVYRADPLFSIQQFFHNLPFQDRTRVAAIVNDLQKADVR
jgi:adenylate cyclase